MRNAGLKTMTLGTATFIAASVIISISGAGQPPGAGEHKLAAPVSFKGHSSWVTSIAVSPDGDVVATGGGETLTIRPGQANFFDPEKNNRLSGFNPHSSTVWAVAISPDGETLATAGTDKLVKLWRTSLGGKMKLVGTLAGHKNWITSISFSPDGKRLASASEDTTVNVWDLQTGKPAGTLAGHTGTVRAVTYSPDGRWIATGSFDKSVRIWD
ncbi:MAG: WD40 repeat domain-containing protein, partial [Planctomycetota bacterium]|nr:WD40 repeat domain-containing protein [Planctomycetota bacterium]